jgi:hypothetical protein
MKRKICAAVMAISLFLIIGLIGGVDNGQPITNMLWAIPLFVAMVVSAVVGEFTF